MTIFDLISILLSLLKSGGHLGRIHRQKELISRG